MKAAIYARYSSENQSEKSIDDQIRVCRKYIENNDMTIEDKHIYIDEAISGSIVNRSGLINDLNRTKSCSSAFITAGIEKIIK